MEYRYSTHKTRETCMRALEHYFASGEVFEAEFSRIRTRHLSDGRIVFDVMLFG